MKYVFSLVLLAITTQLSAQRLENITFVNQGKNIVITYDLEGCTSDETYAVQVKFKEQGGGEVIPNSLSGDIKQVTCGSKRIVWDVFKDKTSFEGKYYVELSVSKMSKGPIDADGYTYKTVKIGNQEWFSENLRTSKYNDGTPIPQITGDAEWSKLTSGAYCFYDNNVANNATYGKLYNWYAVATDKLCPMGWHVPTDAEWTLLTDYLGGKSVAGSKMKSTSGWQENGNGTNTSGFNGLPGGYRFNDGPFGFIGKCGGWWSSSENYALLAWDRDLGYYVGGVYRFYVYEEGGFSVRCLRD